MVMCVIEFVKTFEYTYRVFPDSGWAFGGAIMAVRYRLGDKFITKKVYFLTCSTVV